MLIRTGTQERLITETTVGAGVTTQQGSITSDSLLATLWVNSITSGTLDISIYTLTDNGKQVLLFSFPTITSGSTDLLLKKSGISLQRFSVVVTYTGICSYEMYVRAIEGAGESSTQIVGAANLVVSQTVVGTSATILIPSSLTDRAGLVVRNWSGTGTLYVGESLVKADPSIGYPIAPKEQLGLDVAAGAVIYAISDSGNLDIRIAEAG